MHAYASFHRAKYMALFAQNSATMFDFISKFLRQCSVNSYIYFVNFSLVIGAIEGCVESNLYVDMIPVFMYINNPIFVCMHLTCRMKIYDDYHVRETSSETMIPCPLLAVRNIIYTISFVVLFLVINNFQNRKIFFFVLFTN
jgi:hypothetical protein